MYGYLRPKEVLAKSASLRHFNFNGTPGDGEACIG
jgi:hypothetical protein